MILSVRTFRGVEIQSVGQENEYTVMSGSQEAGFDPLIGLLASVAVVLALSCVIRNVSPERSLGSPCY